MLGAWAGAVNTLLQAAHTVRSSLLPKAFARWDLIAVAGDCGGVGSPCPLTPRWMHKHQA